MAGDGKQSAGSLSSSGILWLVLLGAGALFLREVPWQGSRPAGTELKRYGKAAYQDVDARLWQDPMGAVAQAREEARKRLAGETAASAAAAGQHDHDAGQLLCASGDTRRTEKDVLVIAAMVSGAPYPERTEFRRRARYAILSGLNETGFVPADEEHLGFFLPAQQAATKTSEKPMPDFIAYEWLVPTESNLPGHALPTMVDGRPAKAQNVLLLWLDEDLFGDDPNTKIQRVAASLTRCYRPGEKLRVAVLGPSATWPLQNMIAAKPDPQKAPANPDLSITYYAYGATADEPGLLADVPARVPATASPSSAATGPASVHALLKERGISLFRTIASDDKLADSLATELWRRDVRPNERCTGGEGRQPRCQHVVLIAERDSFYGRSLPWTVAGKLVGTGAAGAPMSAYPPWVHAYSYLRGLDGQLPAPQSSGDSGGKKDDADVKAAAPGPAADAKRIERPDGQGQYDYLRRLSDGLVTLDADLRTHGNGAIRAIGVLGSDVYDKLLILQALRAQFPNAIVFTTDIEAIDLHPQQLEWTRNAIVASSFGLQLDPALQRDIPPFRDGYQTSLFLSTMIAVRQARSRAEANGPACVDIPALGDEERCLGISQERIDKWLEAPRVFEIGRRAAFDFSEPRAPPRRAGEPPSRCNAHELGACLDVHPPPSPMYPAPSARWIQVAFLLFVGVAVLWGLVSGSWGSLGAWLFDTRHSHELTSRRRVAVGSLALVALALTACLYVWIDSLWGGMASRLTEAGAGEPIALIEGVSIWPTMLLRVLATALSVWFICLGWRALTANLDGMSHTLGLDESRDVLFARMRTEARRWPWWLRLVRVFSYRLSERKPRYRPINAETGLGPVATRFWLKYMYQGRWVARFWRVTVATVAYFAAGILVIKAMGAAETPYRGDLAIRLEPWIRYASVFAMLFLIFFVVDATVFCYQLVRALREEVPQKTDTGPEVTTGAEPETRWPLPTLAEAGAALGVDQRYLDDWITMHFVGRRTKVVARLVYYPFIVISLMVVSRSALFDNWSTSIGLAIVITVSVAIVIGCALLLRLAAEELRRRAIWRLGNAKIPLTAQGEDGRHAAEQIELMIEQIRAFDTGAFAPYSQQPLVKALLLPLTSYGGAALVEYLSIANF